MADESPELTPQDSQTEAQGPALTPINLSKYPPRGKYASFDVSDQPMFGPDELEAFNAKSAVDDLTDTVTRADASARNFEVLQTWEPRLFGRGFHYLNSGKNGLTFSGAVNGSRATGSEIMATWDNAKMFAANVYGKRMRQFASAIAREIPGVTFAPKSTRDPIDQEAAAEAEKYHMVWINQADLKGVADKMARLFYTDGRVALYTRSVANEQEWGTEVADEQQDAFGSPNPAGVTPETEMQQQPDDSELPAVREVTSVHGKLEHKCPLMCDDQSEMPWQRISKEVNTNILKERYPWIKDKIKAGGSGSKNGGGADQLDRIARINVRLLMQASTSSGESWQQDATETRTWFRPSQYHEIKDPTIRDLFFENFPKGLLVVHAGGELAFIRNESMDDHLRVVHPYEGDGQNRDSVGNNYLPIQKRLNASLSLADRYFRAAVARRFADSEALDMEAIRALPSDPDIIIPVKVPAGGTLDSVTAVEKVPTISAGLMEYVQYLIEQMPEQMDGMTPAIWGGSDSEADEGVFATAQLKRNQALQILSMPWSAMNWALADVAQQAVECGARNRIANIDANVPGEGRITVELSKLRGNVICEPESTEIPQTLAEQEAQMSSMVEASTKVPIYGAIVNNPVNLPAFSRMPSVKGMKVQGSADVEQQQGEIELLSESGPLPNPQIAQMQEQLQQIAQQLAMAEGDPEAMTPEGQQALMQLQRAEQELTQQLQQLIQTKPLVSSVPVAQDGSEDHAIHAATILDAMKSAEGRKLKNGTPEQQQIFQNWKLHWEEHVEMGQQLTPPKEMEFKGSVTIDPSKYAPDAQAKMLQAAGLQVAPEELNSGLEPREVTTEKEGINAQGVPVKQKITMSNPASHLN